MWKTKMLSDEYKLHPDYWESSIMGRWHDGMSVFQAFTEEMKVINDLSKLMGRPIFFKEAHTGDKRPRNFGFLIRPTLKEFNEFVHLLDKLISENINLDFFQNEVPYHEEIQRQDGTIEKRPKGSLSILNDWLDAYVHFEESQRQRKNEMVKDFKNVRQLRQNPAHKIEEDVFDQQYLEQQREVMSKTFGSLRALRCLFQFHPKAKDYKAPESLERAKIRLF